MEKIYFNRFIVFGSLVVIGGMMLVDGMPQFGSAHGKAKQWVDPYLDVTGLWQGSWALFAPTPDHLNVQIGATVYWRNGTTTDWFQPDWSSMNPWQKMISFREMSYYDNIWRDHNAAGWEVLCRHIATEESKKSGMKPARVELFQRKDLIPKPIEQWRRAYSRPNFGPRITMYRWVPND